MMNDSNYNYSKEAEPIDPFYNFDSFVDPNMLLLPEDMNYASDLAVIDGIPALPSAIPSMTGSEVIEDPSATAATATVTTETTKPGSLYDKLTTTPKMGTGSPCIPSSPSLYPYGSPYSMGSPSALMISSSVNDAAWMHSNRPRRRRSTYASPSLMPQNLHQAHNYAAMASPNQMALGFNAMNMPYGNPMMSGYHHPYMMAPPMSPMNVTVKLPMAPLTPTNYSSSNTSVKIPLVLPCHLQQQQQPQPNSAAPNISKLQTNVTNVSSNVSSSVPSRCSSIAPNSSISSRSSTSRQTWFTEMSVTKDRFLKDVQVIDFTNVTVLELKQILRKFGLNSTGKKVELVERIKEIANYLKSEGRKRVKIDVEGSSEDCAVSVASSIHSELTV